ncbi:MAG TPA: hypothetical protein VFS24_01000 [Steroidobacteraceae bacterium]|nr:hypothetical protein [Steroidobacteraceae bacterium]
MAGIIGIVLFIITAISYLIGLMTLADAKTSMHEIYSAICFTCGTVALASLGVMSALANVRDRLPEPQKKPQEFHP